MRRRQPCCYPFLLLLPVLALAPGASVAVAGTEYQGPRLSEESAAPSALDRGNDVPRGQRLARRRELADLLVPVPRPFFGGMFIWRGIAATEHRTLSGRPEDSSANMGEGRTLPRTSDVLASGAMFIPHATEAAPKWFFIVTRFGTMNLLHDRKPMTEIIVGTDIGAPDMPVHFDLEDTSSGQTRLLVRYRQFPGFHRWLFLAGQKLERSSGLSFDFEIPTHIFLGWESPEATWKIYSGLRWVGREYAVPATNMQAPGAGDAWTDGYTTTYLAGVRRAISSPLFVALEAGVQSETLSIIDNSGTEVLRHKTKFGPWVQAALETWVRSP